MSLQMLLKLVAIFSVIALGWIAARARWLGEGEVDRTLSTAAFNLFVPALMFRTTARLDLGEMPWSTLAAFFGPMLSAMVVVYAVLRRRRRAARQAAAAGAAVEVPPVAAPAVRAITVTFGNTVQLGIPMAQALFGEAGLAVHLAIVSLHALTILTVITLLVEVDLAREQARSAGVRPSLRATMLSTVRATVVHPVVLPVLAGLAWNLLGLPLPKLADETLAMLGQAVVPVCLVVIGISLDRHGVRGSLKAAAWTCALKLLVLPALVLVVGRWVAGLQGVPLAVIVLCAALPAGSNSLLFAQRYRTLEGETSAAIVLATFAFVATAPVWLYVVGRVG